MSNALTLTVPDGVPFIDWTREFDYPVGDVFHAHSDPSLVRQWMGPDGTRLEIARWDFVSGGGFQYSGTGPDGAPFSFRGVFHTVRPNDFAIQTFEYDGYPDVVSIEFLKFEDLGDDRSRLVGHAVYPSQEARDGMAASGMESGMAQGYDRLEGMLAEE